MGNQQPLVSIVIPCYNHEGFVQETIQSVIEQDYKNIELIIIDDGSADNSVEVIKEMLPACEERFTRFEFRHRPNKGLCATLNEALEWCKGEFFAPVASDDILRKYKTSTQVDYLNKNPSSIGVFGGVELIYEDTGVRKNIVKRPGVYNFKDIFLHEYTLPAPTQLLRLELVREIDGYKEDLAIEDWSMWLFLTEHGGTLDYINTVFTSYRQHDGNLSSQFDKMHSSRLQIIELFKSSFLYKKALARAYIVTAQEFQSVDLKKSFSYVKKAFLTDYSVLFSPIFIKYPIKLFLFYLNK